MSNFGVKDYLTCIYHKMQAKSVPAAYTSTVCKHSSLMNAYFEYPIDGCASLFNSERIC